MMTEYQRASENASTGATSKRGSQKQASSCEYRDVLRALAADDDARALVLAEFRRRGGTPDSWRLVATRSAMAEALTHTEDRFELEHPMRQAIRLLMRDVRRRLEWELWP